MTTALDMGDADDYLARLGMHLALVGIPPRTRDRILAEAADHLVDGEVEDFGDPQAIAQQFADELATAQGRRAAFRGFGALAAAGRRLRGGLAARPARGRLVGRDLRDGLAARARGRDRDGRLLAGLLRSGTARTAARAAAARRRRGACAPRSRCCCAARGRRSPSARSRPARSRCGP